MKAVFLLTVIMLSMAWCVDRAVDHVKGVPTCVEKTTIKDIVSIYHRGGTILLSNGNVRDVGQGYMYKVGDDFCARYERIKQ